MYSNTLDRYVEKGGKMDSVVKKQLSAKYRLVGIFVENGNWKKLIRHPILTIGMYWLRIRVGFQYLRCSK